MEAAWRWFGPDDPVTLTDARQAGATGIVTALHDHPPGAVWELEQIQRRMQTIQAHGLQWSVVESLPVSEEIKTRTGPWQQHIEAYRKSLIHLAQSGLGIVCYNFMPVLEWTRTDLAWRMPDGAIALRFDATAFAAFDLFLLKREGAELDWSETRTQQAWQLYRSMTATQQDKLIANVLAGLPGTGTGYSLATIHMALDRYKDLTSTDTRSNLGEFLRAVCPAAAEAGIRLCIHPDDPPRSLLGLPRIVSNAADLSFILAQTPEASNGITFCTGSFGVAPENDLPAMAQQFASRIYFAHLRSTQREADPESFHEAAHLEGDVDMVAVASILLNEERRRFAAGSSRPLPFRPDHGHQLLSDQRTESRPGYPAIGRLRGLAEVRGILHVLGRLSPTELQPEKAHHGQATQP